MIFFWFGLTVLLAGHAVVAGGVVADAWRARRGWGLAKPAGLALAFYLAIPALLHLALGSGAAWMGALAVLLVSSTGLAALLRILQVHGRPVWPRLREGLRGAFKQSRGAWLVNAILSVWILVSVGLGGVRIERAFKGFGEALPGLTQLVIDDSDWLRRSVLFVPPALALLHVFYLWWDGLTRAGAGAASAIRWFRGLVWAGMGLYLLLVAVAVWLPIRCH